ncbi:unnamed protein product [Cylicostephanus goldi]|uniref:Uncharacterized protein n=1 Tax=Cylicostephanus goldi TaxID=71465 RepID=A0A3P7MJE9_CYLGO|nr:unnamed protein product [Cylicostephanus goldi]
MVEPTLVMEPPITSLFECISGGILHLDKAAKVMASKMRGGSFNQAAHDVNFLKSDIATEANFRFDDLNRLYRPDATHSNALATGLMSELALSRQQKVAQLLEITEKTTPPSQDRTLSLQKLR